MSYKVLGQSGRVEKSFFEVLNKYTKEEQAKIWHILLENPKGSGSTHWTLKKVGKSVWQLDLPYGYRLIYTVLDKQQAVLIIFSGNHDDAATYLRMKK